MSKYITEEIPWMLLVISGLIWDQLRFNWDRFRRPRQWIRIPLLIQRDKKESSYEIDIYIYIYWWTRKTFVPHHVASIISSKVWWSVIRCLLGCYFYGFDGYTSFHHILTTCTSHIIGPEKTYASRTVRVALWCTSFQFDRSH